MKFPDSWKEYGMLKGRYMVILGLIVFVCAVVIIATIVFTIESSECAYSSKQYGKPTHYHKLYGCYMEIEKGQSIKVENYNGFKPVK